MGRMNEVLIDIINLLKDYPDLVNCFPNDDATNKLIEIIFKETTYPIEKSELEWIIKDYDLKSSLECQV